MKKIITMFFAGLLAAGSVCAMDDIIELSGEIKTGMFMEQRNLEGETHSRNAILNNDGDSGEEGNRIRFGIALHTKGIGIRTRFSQDIFKYRSNGIEDTSTAQIKVDFAYVYGNLFNSQLKISGGLLGESPWGTGGPELGKELEFTGLAPVAGIRFEWKPLGSLRGLNIGFVLNRADEGKPADAQETFGDLFMESIVGIAWEHPYFAFRFAYRFDRDLDSPAASTAGEKFVYRVEERILWRFVPGMSVWANGYCQGINAGGNRARSDPGYIQNWFYIAYAPEYFTTGINIGYRDEFEYNIQKLEFRPYFYYNIVPNHLIAGLMGGMEMGFNGGKSFEDAFYNFWFVEPQVKVNINPNFYIAAVYRFTSGAYGTEKSYIDQATHWVNLRLGFTF
jgi:hypothetical protein